MLDDKNHTIARLTCLATYINTIFILGNMFQDLDLQNIFNPFNGTLIERKQDTWSFLKTQNVFYTQRSSPSRLLIISHAVYSYRIHTKPFPFMKVAIISFSCYAYWTATFSFPSFSYWQGSLRIKLFNIWSSFFVLFHTQK